MQKNMLTKKEISLEIETIQSIIAPEYISKKISIKEALDNLRIIIQYLKLDNESLRRELADAKKKKA